MAMPNHPLVILVDENPSTLVELTRALMQLDVSLAWFTTTADATSIFHGHGASMIICGPDVDSDEAEGFLTEAAARAPSARLLLLRFDDRPTAVPSVTTLTWPLTQAALRAFITNAALFPAAIAL